MGSTYAPEEVKFGGKISSKLFNENNNELAVGINELFNDVIENNTKINEVQSILNIEDSYINNKINELEESISLLEENKDIFPHNNQSQIIFSDPKNIGFGEDLDGCVSIDDSKQINNNYNYNAVTLPVKRETSRIFLYNEEEEFVPNDVKITIETPEYPNVIEKQNDVRKCFYTNYNKVWRREFDFSEATNGPNEEYVKLDMTIDIPESIAANRTVNTIKIAPFPNASVIISNVLYQSPNSNEFEPLDTHLDYYDDEDNFKDINSSKNTILAFNDIDISKLKITFKQNEKIPGTDKYVIGARHIGVYNTEYNDSGEFYFNFHTNTQVETIKDIKFNLDNLNEDQTKAFDVIDNIEIFAEETTHNYSKVDINELVPTYQNKNFWIKVSINNVAQTSTPIINNAIIHYDRLESGARAEPEAIVADKHHLYKEEEMEVKLKIDERDEDLNYNWNLPNNSSGSILEEDKNTIQYKAPNNTQKDIIEVEVTNGNGWSETFSTSILIGPKIEYANFNTDMVKIGDTFTLEVKIDEPIEDDESYFVGFDMPFDMVDVKDKRINQDKVIFEFEAKQAGYSAIDVDITKDQYEDKVENEYRQQITTKPFRIINSIDDSVLKSTNGHKLVTLKNENNNLNPGNYGDNNTIVYFESSEDNIEDKLKDLTLEWNSEYGKITFEDTNKDIGITNKKISTSNISGKEIIYLRAYNEDYSYDKTFELKLYIIPYIEGISIDENNISFSEEQNDDNKLPEVDIFETYNLDVFGEIQDAYKEDYLFFYTTNDYNSSLESNNYGEFEFSSTAIGPKEIEFSLYDFSLYSEPVNSDPSFSTTAITDDPYSTETPVPPEHLKADSKTFKVYVKPQFDLKEELSVYSNKEKTLSVINDIAGGSKDNLLILYDSLNIGEVLDSDFYECDYVSEAIGEDSIRVNVNRKADLNGKEWNFNIPVKVTPNPNHIQLSSFNRRHLYSAVPNYIDNDLYTKEIINVQFDGATTKEINSFKNNLDFQWNNNINKLYQHTAVFGEDDDYNEANDLLESLDIEKYSDEIKPYTMVEIRDQNSYQDKTFEKSHISCNITDNENSILSDYQLNKETDIYKHPYPECIIYDNSKIETENEKNLNRKEISEDDIVDYKISTINNSFNEEIHLAVSFYCTKDQLESIDDNYEITWEVLDDDNNLMQDNIEKLSSFKRTNYKFVSSNNFIDKFTTQDNIAYFAKYTPPNNDSNIQHTIKFTMKHKNSDFSVSRKLIFKR